MGPKPIWLGRARLCSRNSTGGHAGRRAGNTPGGTTDSNKRMGLGVAQKDRQEEIALATAWVCALEDPVLGNYQNKVLFWKRPGSYFSTRCGEGSTTEILIRYRGSGPILTKEQPNFNRFTNAQLPVGEAGQTTRM